MTYVYSILAGMTLVVAGLSLGYVGYVWPDDPEYLRYPMLGGQLFWIGEKMFWLGCAVLIIPRFVLFLGQVIPHPTAEQDAHRELARLGLLDEYLGKGEKMPVSPHEIKMEGSIRARMNDAEIASARTSAADLARWRTENRTAQRNCRK